MYMTWINRYIAVIGWPHHNPDLISFTNVPQVSLNCSNKELPNVYSLNAKLQQIYFTLSSLWHENIFKFNFKPLYFLNIFNKIQSNRQNKGALIPLLPTLKCHQKNVLTLHPKINFTEKNLRYQFHHRNFQIVPTYRNSGNSQVTTHVSEKVILTTQLLKCWLAVPWRNILAPISNFNGFTYHTVHVGLALDWAITEHC